MIIWEPTPISEGRDHPTLGTALTDQILTSENGESPAIQSHIVRQRYASPHPPLC
jgi:hypothetical protein